MNSKCYTKIPLIFTVNWEQGFPLGPMNSSELTSLLFNYIY